MANIMINSRCNLKCPYCFAKEKLHDEEMSIDNYKKALNFIIDSNEEYAGIIGGEPTLHSRFNEILRIGVNSPLQRLCLFTNLTNIDDYMDLISHRKISVLVNFNDKTTMGVNAYEHMCKRLIDIKEKYENDKITLGLNLYAGTQPEQLPDLLYFAKFYKAKQIRVTPSVPSLEYLKENSLIDYFREIKPAFIAVCNALDSIGATITHDCNFIPRCVFDEAELEHLENLSAKYNNPYIARALCNPVMDILPNLDIIRCFGISATESTNLDEHKNLNEVRGYFMTRIDEYLRGTPLTEACIECGQRKHGCNMGCLRAKIFNLESCKEYFRQLCRKENITCNGRN